MHPKQKILHFFQRYSTVFKWLLGALWVALLVGSGVYGWQHHVSFAEIHQAVWSWGAWAPVIFMVFYMFRTFLFLPIWLMNGIGVALFGPLWGFVLAYLGQNLAASLAFGVARFLGRDIIARSEKAELKKLEKWLVNHDFMVVVMLRLMPFIPFDLINFASGLTAIKYRDYALATAISIIPDLAFFTFLQSALFTFDYHYLVYAGGSFVVLVSGMGYFYLKTRKER